MFQLNDEDNTKEFMKIKMNINELKLNLKMINNQRKFNLKRKILHNNTYNSKKINNIVEKYKKRNNIDYLPKTINNFYSDINNHNIENGNELIMNKIMKFNKPNKQNNINLLNFCTFPSLEIENNTKSNFNKKNNSKEKKINYKSNIKIDRNPSEVYYSPEFFENYISKSPQNEKTEKYKYKIFLNEKKEIKKNNNVKKTLSSLNLDEINNEIKKNILIKPVPNLSHFMKNIKKFKKYSFINLKKDKTLKNKETSISTYFPNKNDIKNDNSNVENKIIDNIFTDKKKMFRSHEIIILNNLNIIYSENDKQFNKFYIKHANKKTLYGLGLTHITSSPDLIKKNIDSKIYLVKDKLSLIKSIVDYTYPEIIIRRSMKQSNNYIKKFKSNIRPCKLQIINNQKKEKFLSNHFSPLLNILNSKKEVI